MKPTLHDLPYFPRPALLESILAIYRTGLAQGITLFAPRRQGKTSFVRHELLPAAANQNWQPVYLDLWSRREQPELALVEGLEAAARQGQGLFQRPLKLDKLRTTAKLPGMELQAEVTPEAALAVLQEDLSQRLARALAALLARHPQVLLVLDEFQALASADSEGFVAAFRAAIQRYRGQLILFYTGSSREALNAMFRRHKAPLFASAHPLTLPDLGEEFVADRAAFLQERTGLRVHVPTLEQAFIRMGRTPEFLNSLIINLMLAGSTDIAGAIDAWLRHQQEETSVLLAELTPLDLAVLGLLAKPVPPKLFGREALAYITQATGEPITTGRIQTAIKRLSRKDLVAPTGGHGEYEVNDRAMLVYLREAG
jgi:hypothetical protein